MHSSSFLSFPYLGSLSSLAHCFTKTDCFCFVVVQNNTILIADIINTATEACNIQVLHTMLPLNELIILKRFRNGTKSSRKKQKQPMNNVIIESTSS